MTLSEGKVLLEKYRIPYHMTQYESEGEYFQHLMPGPGKTDSPKNQVAALVIPAVNGVKNIELQFNRRRGEYIFRELYFGSFCFELFYQEPGTLEADILDIIGRIVDGKLAVVERFDLKRKRWVSDGSFDLSSDDNVFGAPGFREAVAKIEAPRSLGQKLIGRKCRYDIYDWRTWRQIVK